MLWSSGQTWTSRGASHKWKGGASGARNQNDFEDHVDGLSIETEILGTSNVPTPEDLVLITTVGEPWECKPIEGIRSAIMRL